MSSNTSSGRKFSKCPVHSKTDSNGLQHNVYVMYHATKRHNVPSILRDGFKPSTSGMLGPGLYLSRDIDKTRAYGDVCLKVLAYTGKTRKMDSADNSGSWRAAYDSAYLPPNNKVVASGREETCLKSVSQVRILGVAYGFTNLNGKTRAEVRNLEGTTDSLDEEEERELRKMLQNISIVASAAADVQIVKLTKRLMNMSFEPHAVAAAAAAAAVGPRRCSVDKKRSPRHNHYECPSGHRLELVTVGLNWVCDQCDDHNSGKQPRWRCGRCDYDECTTCPATESGSSSEYVKRSSMQLHLQCPSGHRLELVTVGLNWVCDQCDDHNSGKQPRWRCGRCDYDKCTSC